MNKNIIIEHTRIVTPVGHEARRGASMAELSVVDDGCVIVTGGIIEYVGPTQGRPATSPDVKYNRIDACGNVLLPGFVDSHTHLIFGGFRPDEFEWRLKGDSYMSIMERGGGIQSTVDATRQASQTDLENKAQWFVDRMSEMGVTTVEAKSGYGLDEQTELKMLEAIRELA